MSRMECERRLVRASAAGCAAKLGAVVILLASAAPASANFHIAKIDELMTSYGGDANVQFVEILMTAGGQGVVNSSKLTAFDSQGQFIGTVLTVSGNVSGGADRRWIMGTTAFEQASGLDVDFVFAPGLPVGGGMVCWGKPSVGNEDDASCDTSFGNYIDCVAYGSYSGPPNNCIGTATPLLPDGHSLRRSSCSSNNLADFECADPADPENNARASAQMAATTSCDATTSTTTTSTSTTTATMPQSVCGDPTGDGQVTATDALLVLQAAVELTQCGLSVCDVDDSGNVAATDALIVLAFATMQPIELVCPAA